MRFRHYFGQVFGLETTIAAVVFVLVLGAMITAMLLSRARRRRGRGPARAVEHSVAELSYVVVVAAVAFFLIAVSLESNSAETTRAHRTALTIRVTGQQWCWSFRYLNQPANVSVPCNGGSTTAVVVPEGIPVRFEVTSRDVVHGFWIPYLRWKSDTFPGHVNTFTVTFTRAGTWTGRCSNYCGLLHYQMDFTLEAMPLRRFDHWLRVRGGSALHSLAGR